ncbi:MAG: leucine-rich repeat domain-containing protein [Polyangiaceae bacterium]|nr:leucine-rich repeat domain-containing protein [Polyangiaceae bacterium]
MAAQLLDDDLLANLRARGDAAEYDRLLAGFEWKNGTPRPGRAVKAGAGASARRRVLRLLADAPNGSTRAPALREYAPRELRLTGDEVDLGCVRGLAPLEELQIVDATLLHGVDAVASLPKLYAIGIYGVHAIREGERFTHATLRSLRAYQPITSHVPPLRVLPHLGEMPELGTLTTRVGPTDDLRVLAAYPRLWSLRLERVPTHEALAALPLLPDLSVFSVSIEPEGGRMAPPGVVSLDATRFPSLLLYETQGPTGRVESLPPKLDQLVLGQLAPGFSVSLQTPTAVKTLSLKSDREPISLDFLRWFPALERLTLDGPGIASLDGLAACPSLRELYLYNTTAATDASYLRAHPVPQFWALDSVRKALGLPPQS